MSRGAASCVLVLSLLALAPADDASAQSTFDAQFDPDRFVLTSDPTSIGLTESADPLAARVMAVGLAVRLGGAPLSTPEGDIVGDRVGMDLTYAIGFGRFGLHAQLPVVIHQSSDFGPAMGGQALASGGVGDVRLGGKVWLLRKGGLTLGGDLTFSLPTNSGSFTGDAGTVIEPRALASWRQGRISLGGGLGYALRTADQTVADLHVGDELLFTVGAEYAITPDQLGVGLAVSSRVGVTSPPDEMMDLTDDAEQLTEALASVRYWVTDSIAIEGAAGTALESGYGAAPYRVLAGVRWMHRPATKAAPLVVEPPLAPLDTDDAVVEPADEDPPEVVAEPEAQPEPEPESIPEAAPEVTVTATEVELYETIFFDLDKATIKTRSFKVIDAVANTLAGNPDLRVRVEGHSDETGTEAWNQTLSEQRAQAVVDYLIEHGVAADRLEAAGFGSSVPLQEGDSEKARAKNRRVEFKIIP